MTAKILTRQSFSKATNYVFKDGRSEVIDSRGIIATDPQTAAACFKIQATNRPEIKSPVGHICISFHPDDAPRLTNDLMVELCAAYMEGMEIKDTQFLLVRHYDTEHPHMHLIYNRIDNNGELISDKMSYIRNEKVCKQIKTEYGLTFSPGKQNVKLDRLRTKDRRRYEMYNDVKKTLNEAASFVDFLHRLNRVGIRATVKTTRKGDLQGITFKRNGYSIKGSKLDRSLSIIKILDHFKKEKKTVHYEPPIQSKPQYAALSRSTSMITNQREAQHESKVQEVAASLFEGNLGKSQEQDMADQPKKKNQIRRRR